MTGNDAAGNDAAMALGDLTWMDGSLTALFGEAAAVRALGALLSTAGAPCTPERVAAETDLDEDAVRATAERLRELGVATRERDEEGGTVYAIDPQDTLVSELRRLDETVSTRIDRGGD